jgi:adenylosuccinate lyase
MKYNLVSPTDFRYSVKDLEEYLTEDAFTKYKAKVELALIKTLVKYNLAPQNIIQEVENAIKKVTTQEVYDEEDRIKHDIRALVNVIRKYVSDSAKPYIHATATSYDIVDTANIIRYRDAIK